MTDEASRRTLSKLNITKLSFQCWPLLPWSSVLPMWASFCVHETMSCGYTEMLTGTPAGLRSQNQDTFFLPFQSKYAHKKLTHWKSPVSREKDWDCFVSSPQSCPSRLPLCGDGTFREETEYTGDYGAGNPINLEKPPWACPHLPIP